jgi:chitodextrinase
MLRKLDRLGKRLEGLSRRFIISSTAITAKSSSSIRVSWSSVSGASYYEVYRGNELRGEATTTSYIDTGLSPNTTYSYRVKAVNYSGSSSFSSPASVYYDGYYDDDDYYYDKE